MTVTWREILFFLILFGANLIQAITGFAGTLLAMPPSMQLLGVDEAKSVLAVLDQLSCLLIVLTGFRHINWKEFGKMAVLMVVGMFAGMKIFEAFPIQQLLTLYGVMILCIALWKLFGQRLMKKSGLSRVRGAEAPQTEENQQTNPQTADTGAWEFVSEDGREALVQAVTIRQHANMDVSYIKLRGLMENTLYREEESGRIYNSTALMEAGIPVPVELGEYRAYQWHFVREGQGD